MDIEDGIALVSAAIALLSALTAGAFAAANFRRERTNQRLNLFSTQQKYFEDIKRWADELCDVISEAVLLCDLDPKRVEGESFYDRRHRIKIRLSSLIDRGRWFFPNVHSDEGQARQGPRFRGYRQEVLNSLVAAYIGVVDLSYTAKEPNAAAKKILVKAKMRFVDEIQQVLDPRRRQTEFEALTRLVNG